MTEINRGSEWRKWDLHVHSPFSVLNTGNLGDGFSKSGQDLDLDQIMDKYIYELFTRALDNEISCIGITDYFVIEGYKTVKDIMKNKKRMSEIFEEKIKEDACYLEKIQQILILPNVELRLDTNVNVIIGESIKSSKVQAHVIFSDSVNSIEIQDSFLSLLKFKDGAQKRHNLTISSLEKHGKSLKKSGVGGPGSDLFVGMNGAHVSIDDVKELVESNFQDKAIIVLAEEDQSRFNWDNQVGSIRKNIYSNCDAIFSSNIKTINWGLGEDCITTIGHKLPSIWGSDAHNYEEMFLPDSDKYCWIKSDTTFEGLLHAVKISEDRIYIGKFPPQLQAFKDRSAYTIKQINIDKKLKNESRVWFNTEIPFNPFMVTIIGNKGSGKSALSDILGYVGNSHNMDNASFLDHKRFLDKKTRYGDEYKAKIEFYSGKDNILEKDELDKSFDSNSPERVKYLPQRYIEEVCNDITDVFQKEINDAIFSYVPTQDKVNTTNIDELIRIKTESLNNQINTKKLALGETNNRILQLENKTKTQYARNIKNLLSESKIKLANHLEQKPVEVVKPNDIEQNEYAQQTIRINSVISEFEENVIVLTQELTHINRLIQTIENFNHSVTKFENEKESLNFEYKEVAKTLDIDIEEFVSVKYKDDDLKLKGLILKEKRIELSKKLDKSAIESKTISVPQLDVGVDEILVKINEYTSIFEKTYILSSYVEAISEKISNSQLLYFEYENKLKKWEESKKMLEGTIDNTESEFSVIRYEKELEYLSNQLPKELDEEKKNRIRIIEEISDLMMEKVNVLESIYKPVQNRISSIEGLNSSNIVFNATLKENSHLVATILSHIDSRVEGKFRGTREGHMFVSDLVASTDFNNKKSIIQFVKAIYEATSANIDNIDTLLKNRLEFNEYLGGLSYLEAIFTIEADGKKMNELSPGERGIVLLIFHLALNKGNIPLIIDQPEDNLDNQSVFTKLVPAIVEAKKNRQIIVVTHNPNIAIACDSEQVIYCEIAEESKTLTYQTGSIENPTTNAKIIDILEGTKPAFNKRRITYKA